MQKKKEGVIPRIFVKESLNLELWLKGYEGLKFQGLFCKFPEKIRKLDFLELFLDGKSVDSVHGAVDRAGPVHCGPAAIAACPSSSELGLRPLQWLSVTPGFKAKPDAHRMYAQDQVVIHTVRM
jgi:hypothetical protein